MFELMAQIPFLDQSDATYIVYTGVALGVFLLFTGLTQVLSRRESHFEARNRRMRLIAKGASTAELLALMKPPQRKSLLNRLPFIGDLPALLMRAGVNIKPTQFLALCAALCFVVFSAALIFIAPLLAGVAAFTIGFALPVFALHMKRKARSDALVSQLPDALDLLARGLRVGHPLNTSIGAIATEMEDPIASEFGIIFDQVSYGDDLTEAFQEFADRADLEDVHYLSASIGIQHGTGGDLARIIAVLSQVVRNRIAMRRKILAISSEGRLSARFLSALPIFIYLSTSMSSPNYYAGVAEDPLYVPMAVFIIGCVILNYLAMRKLVNFRI